MPDYIEVVKRKESRAQGAFIEDEPENYVDVIIGPAILEPIQALIHELTQEHERLIAEISAGDFLEHRRTDKKCPTCKAIFAGTRMLGAIKDRPL